LNSLQLQLVLAEISNLSRVLGEAVGALVEVRREGGKEGRREKGKEDKETLN